MSDSTQRQKRTVLVAAVAGVALVGAIAAGTVALLSGTDGENVAAPGSSSADEDHAGQEPAGEDTEATTPEDDVNEMKPGGGAILAEPLGGQAAIDALGDDLLAVVASRAGKTAEELKDLLLSDSTLRVSRGGGLYFVDPPATPAD